MHHHNKPCIKCFTENDIISKVDNDPRDKYYSKELLQKAEKALTDYNIKKKAYWSSLAKTKCKPTSIKTLTSDQKISHRNKKTPRIDRLIELSKPRVDYYEYTEEIVTRSCFRRKNDERINYLAIPRTRSYVDRTYKCNCKVPLSTLLPRIEKLSVAVKRPDSGDHIRTDEDAFSVKKSALKFVATERLKRLATPRPLYQEDNTL